MIEYTFFPDWSLHHVRARQSCTLLGLVEYGMELGRQAGPQSNLDLPALFDLRAIELDRDNAEDIKQAIRLRKSLKAVTGNNPCAYVVGSKGSFGIMRMYSIYAELEGLRREELTLITEDMDEAIDWILRHMDARGAQAEAVRRALSQLAGAAMSEAVTPAG